MALLWQGVPRYFAFCQAIFLQEKETSCCDHQKQRLTMKIAFPCSFNKAHE
jgi:hypothetical protein